MKFDRGPSLYSMALHALLVALAASTLLLAHQNRALERRLTPPTPEPGIVAGDVVEPFGAVDLEGRELQIAAGPEGERDRLLFIFTTSCPACRENQDQWRSLHRQSDGRYEVIGVSLDPPEATRSYLDSVDVPFDVVTVADPDLFAEQYGVDLVPLTVRVGAGGEVRDSWVGVLSDETVHSL